jgi:hypothetical protein
MATPNSNRQLLANYMVTMLVALSICATATGPATAESPSRILPGGSEAQQPKSIIDLAVDRAMTALRDVKARKGKQVPTWVFDLAEKAYYLYLADRENRAWRAMAAQTVAQLSLIAEVLDLYGDQAVEFSQSMEEMRADFTLRLTALEDMSKVHAKRIGTHEKRLTTLERRTATTGENVEEVETRLDKLNAKTTRLESDVDKLKKLVMPGHSGTGAGSARNGESPAAFDVKSIFQRH